jgi:hypothetical protein
VRYEPAAHPDEQACCGHPATQVELRGLGLVAAVHKLEDVSSAKQIGTLAENLLEGT